MGAFIIPSKMQIGVVPNQLIPANTCTFMRDFALIECGYSGGDQVLSTCIRTYLGLFLESSVFFFSESAW